MRLRCLTISLCLLVADAAASSVGRSQDAAPEKLNGAFIDARLTSDGRLGVFTFNRTTPLSSEYGGGPLIFSRAPKKLLVGPLADRIYVGSYDLETGLIKIFWMKENREWLPGSYKFYIVSVSGEKALVRGWGQPRVPYRWGSQDYYLLDVKSGDFQRLPIPHELAWRRIRLYQVYLVDSDGTMLFETTRPKQPVPVITVPPVDLWLRFPSGKYFLLDRRSHFFRNYSIDGKIYYSQTDYFPAPPHKGLKVYDVKKRISQEVDYRTVTERKYADIELSANGNGNLVASRKVKGTRPEKWEDEVLKINTDILK
jgi:hypothetical protein